jgi:hypothetical protein
MSLSDESIDPGQAKALDEVRAKIFYLASDIESASQPTAILLRAVAESIVDAPETPEHTNGRAGLTGIAASLRYSNAGALRSAGSGTANGVSHMTRHFDDGGTGAGHKG